MEEKETTAEVEATQTEPMPEGEAENVEVIQAVTVNEAKRGGLQDMKKRLPDWSLEPPETFLS